MPVSLNRKGNNNPFSRVFILYNPSSNYSLYGKNLTPIDNIILKKTYIIEKW